MSKQHDGLSRNRQAWALALLLCLAPMAVAQQAGSPEQGSSAPAAQAAPPSDKDKPKGETRITPEQAKQLFGLVDELIQFSSQETGLPVKSDVKRQITSRPVVEEYLKKKFEEDESARRMQRSEIVLKKFGLLDRDFALKPFLLELLKE